MVRDGNCVGVHGTIWMAVDNSRRHDRYRVLGVYNDDVVIRLVRVEWDEGMTTSKIIRYHIIEKKNSIESPTYMIVLVGKKATMRRAMRIATKMGKGAIIQRVSEKRNGKIYVKDWEYTPHD